MEDVWPHILSFLNQRDLLRLESVSHDFNHRIKREWRRRRHLDMQDELKGATHSEDTVLHLLDRFSPRLKCIVIGSRASSSGALTTDSSSSFDSPLSSTSTFFASTVTVTRAIIRKISTRATHLQRLILHRIVLSLPALTALPELPCTVEELEISTCRMDCYRKEDGNLVQDAFAALFHKLRNLKRFEISGRGACYDHFVLDNRVLKRLPNRMNYIALSAGDSLKIADLEFLNQPNLDTFKLSRSFISTTALVSLVKKSPLIRHLDLSYSRNISDFSPISSLSFLSSLNLAGNRDEFRDDALESICTGCPALQQLTLDYCARLTSFGLKRSAVLLK